MDEEFQDLLNINQAAEAAGVRRETIWRWRKEGRLPTVEIGGQPFIRRSDLAKVKRRRKRSGRQA